MRVGLYGEILSLSAPTPPSGIFGLTATGQVQGLAGTLLAPAGVGINGGTAAGQIQGLAGTSVLSAGGVIAGTTAAGTVAGLVGTLVGPVAVGIVGALATGQIQGLAGTTIETGVTVASPPPDYDVDAAGLASWTGVSGFVDTYEIAHDTSAAPTSVTATETHAGISAHTKQLTGLSDNVLYYNRVRCSYQGKKSAWSTPDDQFRKLAAPTSPTATGGDKEVLYGCDAVTGASDYGVNHTIGGTGPPYTDYSFSIDFSPEISAVMPDAATLSEGVIFAIDEFGNYGPVTAEVSDTSNDVEAPPVPTEGLAVSSIDVKRAVVSWTDPQSGEPADFNHYELQLVPTGSSAFTPTLASGDATNLTGGTATPINLVPNQEYTVELRAVDALDNKSSPATVVFTTLVAPVYTATTVGSLVQGDDDDVDGTWDGTGLWAEANMQHEFGIETSDDAASDNIAVGSVDPEFDVWGTSSAGQLNVNVGDWQDAETLTTPIVKSTRSADPDTVITDLANITITALATATLTDEPDTEPPNTHNHTWTHSQSAGRSLLYHLQIDVSAGDFSSPVVDEPTLSATSYLASSLSDSTAYKRRIRAKNNSVTSAWSAVDSFTTGVSSVGFVSTTATGQVQGLAGTAVSHAFVSTLATGQVQGLAGTTVSVAANQITGTLATGTVGGLAGTTVAPVAVTITGTLATGQVQGLAGTTVSLGSAVITGTLATGQVQGLAGTAVSHAFVSTLATGQVQGLAGTTVSLGGAVIAGTLATGQVQGLAGTTVSPVAVTITGTLATGQVQGLAGTTVAPAAATITATTADGDVGGISGTTVSPGAAAITGTTADGDVGGLTGTTVSAASVGFAFADYEATAGDLLHSVIVDTADLWQNTTATTAADTVGDDIQRVDDQTGSNNWQEATNPGTLQTPTAFGSKKVVSNVSGGVYNLATAITATTAGTIAVVFRPTDGTTATASGQNITSLGGSVNRMRVRDQTGSRFTEWGRNEAGGFEQIDKAGDWLNGDPVTVLIIRWSSSSNMDVHYRIDGGTNQGPFNFDPDDSVTTGTDIVIEGDQNQFAAWAFYDADIGATNAGDLLTDAIAEFT